MENIIFADGSSRGNPGPGGWGSVVITTPALAEEANVQSSKVQNVIELGGGEKFTTNNKMELTGAIEGLSRVPENSKVLVYTDSSYVINGITKWINGWKRNGWKTKTKDDVSNKDLWIRLLAETEKRQVEWKHVAGHVGIVGNERCDEIATSFADGEAIRLYKGALSDYDLPKILDISQSATVESGKKSSSSHSKAPAYSYISSVGGVIEVHHSWAECEKRVKGAKGARYKKSTSVGDEARIIEEFEAFLI